MTAINVLKDVQSLSWVGWKPAHTSIARDVEDHKNVCDQGYGKNQSYGNTLSTSYLINFLPGQVYILQWISLALLGNLTPGPHKVWIMPFLPSGPKLLFTDRQTDTLPQEASLLDI